MARKRAGRLSYTGIHLSSLFMFLSLSIAKDLHPLLFIMLYYLLIISVSGFMKHDHRNENRNMCNCVAVLFFFFWGRLISYSKSVTEENTEVTNSGSPYRKPWQCKAFVSKIKNSLKLKISKDYWCFYVPLRINTLMFINIRLFLRLYRKRKGFTRRLSNLSRSK